MVAAELGVGTLQAGVTEGLGLLDTIAVSYSRRLVSFPVLSAFAASFECRDFCRLAGMA